MKKFLKVTGIVVAVLLAVIIIVPMVLKPRIGEIVKREANAMLNARLDFEKLDLSLLRHFPNASIELKGFTLTGTVAPFEDELIARADRISVVVNLMSIFGDSGYEVTKVLLDRPAVLAHKAADGSVNWDIVKDSDEEVEEDDEPSSFRLLMRDFRISEGNLAYADDSTKMYLATLPVELRLRGDMTASQTNLDLLMSLGAMQFDMDGMRLLNRVDMTMKALIAADLENDRYTLADAVFNMNAIELGVDGWVQLGDDDSMTMDLSMNSSKVKFKDILSLIPAFYTKDFENLTASGELSLGAWVKGEMKGDRLPAFNVKLNVANGRFKYAALPKSVDDINIAASVTNNGGSMDATKVDVSKFTLTMAGNSLAGSFSAATPMSDLQFKAAANGKVDLGAIRDVYPLDEGINLKGIVAADMKVAGRMSDIEKERYESIDAEGSIAVEGMTVNLEDLPQVDISRMSATVSPKAMALKEFHALVGASDFSADGSLTNYIGWFLRDDTLGGTLNVRSKLLDANELMSMMPSEGESEAETPAEESAPMTAIEVPKNLKLSMSANVDKILFQQMTLQNFVGRMNVADGKVTIEKLAADAFGGKISGSGSYSTAADPKAPKLTLALGIDKARFEDTFCQLDVVQQVVPLFAKTGGDYSMNIDMNAAMTEDMGIDYHSLNASGKISSENIDIQNIEAFEILAKTLNNDKLRRINAKDVKIAFTIKNGRLNTSPFDIKMGDITMNLSGSTGLDQTIDYAGRISMPDKTTGGVLNNLSLKIGGTFTSPKVSVDLKEAAKEAVTNVVNQQIQKLTGSENLNEEFEKQAAKLRGEAEKAGQKLVSEAEKAGQKLIDEAKKQRDNLVAKASNALTKIAAEKSGDALVKAAETEAAKLKSEAEKQAAKLNAEAETEVDKLREKIFANQ